MEFIKQQDKVLVIGKNQEAAEELQQKYSQCSNIIITSLSNISSIEEYDCGITSADLCTDGLPKIMQILKPNGVLIVHPTEIVNNIEFSLVTNGFINVSLHESGIYVGYKPGYKLGSTVKLNLSKPAPVVWKLDDDDDKDLIDADNLLDDDDLRKPTIDSLRVCGTTGKRKACKDCSCGLAEELTKESTKNGEMVVDTTNASKSSCGSCYLGDAFRCATCPYLGMPAFKPGERIQLSGTQLDDDL